MQLRLKPRTQRNFISRSLVIKIVLIFTLFFLALFVIDKIKLPKPGKFIQKEISNDKLNTLK